MIRKRNPLISIEGLPCSGVTKQANRLITWLDDKDIDPIQVRTPGGTQLGREIDHLLSGRPDIRRALTPKVETLLLQADIAQLYEETVLPALSNGDFAVVQEGGMLSILAHMGIYCEESTETIKLGFDNLSAVKSTAPDMTIFLDCQIPTIENRAQHLCRYYPYVNHELHLIRDMFMTQATLNPDAIKVVNGENSIEAVFNDILFYVKPLLRGRGYDTDEQ